MGGYGRIGVYRDKDDLESYKCLVNVTFTNLKGPISKTFKLLKV